MANRGLAGESAEMYLKSLCELGGDELLVPIADLARRLGISPVSATERVHRLEEQGLLRHTPYRGIRLTRRGTRQARRILRRHRLWERFLADRLQIPWADVHDLACQLEHAVGDAVTERLAVLLQEPTTCPHGNPIPSAQGGSAPARGVALSDLSHDQSGRVLRIQAESGPLLSVVQAIGLHPGTALTKRTADAPDQPILVEMAGGRTQVPQHVATHIMVDDGDRRV